MFINEASYNKMFEHLTQVALIHKWQLRWPLNTLQYEFNRLCYYHW